MSKFKAAFFDVFGTVVDWRTSIIKQGNEFSASKNQNIDWERFADEWRGLYQPSMQKVRSGERPWVPLDVLHRESLDTLLDQFNVTDLSEQEKQFVNCFWHRLLAWPDSSKGLYAIKKQMIIATMTNGNIALMVNLARYSDLPWDVILGAEQAGQFKPMPEVYLKGAQALSLEPEECLMVAAHNSDLAAARELGLGTAFIPRPTEYGPDQDFDLEAEQNWDYIVKDLVDLADQLSA